MSEYEQVIKEILSLIDQESKKYNKIYQNLTPEKKSKWDKLRVELDKLGEIELPSPL